jgi:hypothetical protein
MQLLLLMLLLQTELGRPCTIEELADRAGLKVSSYTDSIILLVHTTQCDIVRQEYGVCMSASASAQLEAMYAVLLCSCVPTAAAAATAAA